MFKFNSAVILLLSILSIAGVYHILILFQAIDYEAAWGGRLNSEKEMYIFETISLIINFLLFLLVLKRKKQYNLNNNGLISKVLCYIAAFIFVLNTIGNLSAKNQYELILGTIFTSFAAASFYRLAKF